LLIIKLIFFLVFNVISTLPGIKYDIIGFTTGLLITNIVFLILALVISIIRSCKYFRWEFRINL